MESDREGQTEDPQQLAHERRMGCVSAMQKEIANLTHSWAKIQAKDKTDDELAEEFIKEHKVIRPNHLPINIENPFNDNTLDRLDITLEAIQLLPDGAIKNQMYWLFKIVNEAAIAVQQGETAAYQWRGKADAFLLELLKETWVKRHLRETNGNMGRAF